MFLFIYNAYSNGTIIRKEDVMYNDISFSTLNIEREFTNECVIMQGISDLLL